MAERTGLEPATPGVTGRYSNQLNYRSKSWWVLRGSNPDIRRVNAALQQPAVTKSTTCGQAAVAIRTGMHKKNH